MQTVAAVLLITNAAQCSAAARSVDDSDDCAEITFNNMILIFSVTWYWGDRKLQARVCPALEEEAAGKAMFGAKIVRLKLRSSECQVTYVLGHAHVSCTPWDFSLSNILCIWDWLYTRQWKSFGWSRHWVNRRPLYAKDFKEITLIRTVTKK